MEPIAGTYDALPYDGTAFAATHPDSLAVVAMLHGLRPPPVERCRVLELGCGTGGNLVPMAYAMREARFLGIDFSPAQIETGREMVRSLGLANIELRAQDILTFDDEETFDYIICHGVYSWVPPEVQRKILLICRRSLVPEGLATVSYNVYPGWYANLAVRDILRFGARGAAAPQEQVRAGLEFLAFVAANLREPDTPPGASIRQAAETLARQRPAYVFHEYLEECNSPLRYEEFVARAAEAGLQCIDEAHPTDTASRLSEDARRAMERFAPEPARREQCLDFLRGQTFRRTVLCHKEARIARELQPGAIRDMDVLSASAPVSASPDVVAVSPEQFRNDDKGTLSTNMPPLKAALVILHEAAPRALPFGELWQAVRRRLGREGAGQGEDDVAELAGPLLSCAIGKMANLRVYSPPLAAEPSDRPVASAVARMLAGADKADIVTLRHRVIRIDDLSRRMLALLDGTRDRRRLAEDLVALARSGVAVPEFLVPDAAELERDPAPILDRLLREFARCSLLLAQ